MKTLRIFVTFFAFAFSTLTLAAPININTADVQALSKNIKGVGLKKAQAIVAFRDKNGKFKTIQDLKKVKGIGSKLLEKNIGTILVKNK